MLEKITAEELVGKGVIGMDDSPKLTAEEMQKKFEETAREVIVPKFNRLIEALTGENGAGEVGAADPVTGENVTVQKALESLLKATVHTVVQELTAEQRQTARDNIRALSWETDALEPGQQAQARANIGAASTMDTYALEQNKAPKEHISQTPMYGKGSGMAYGHVLIKDTPDETLDVSKGAAATPKALYNAMQSRVSVEEQELTDGQRGRARSNIRAVGYEPQTIETWQQQVVRRNIGAVSAAEAKKAVEEEYFTDEVELVPAVTVVCDQPGPAEAGSGAAYFYCDTKIDTGIFNDYHHDKVIVNMDGEDVECSVSYSSQGYPSIGNLGLVNNEQPNTGEEFLISFGRWNHIVYHRSYGEHTFSISMVANLLKSEYLPRTHSVSYDEQYLTDEQKAQARENIGAAAVGEGGGEVGDITWDDIGVTYGDTLTWDLNTEGRVNAGGVAFKISNATPTYSDFAKGGYAVTNVGKIEFQENEIPEEELVLPDGIIDIDNFITVVPAEMAGVESEYLGTTFPEAGTYFTYAPEYGMLATGLQLNGYNGFQAKEKIPVDRLPLAEIGGVANWDAAEGEPGYMPNKPFGNEREIIFPEFELPVVDGTFPFPAKKVPVPGNVYTVVWNGVEYNCETVVAGDNFIFFQYEGGIENAPFEIVCIQGTIAALAKDGSTTVTLEIYRDYVKKLDSEFLPESGVTAGTYGDYGNEMYYIPIVTVDETGRVTAARQTTIYSVEKGMGLGLMPYTMYSHIANGLHVTNARGNIQVGGEATVILGNCAVISSIYVSGEGYTAFPKVYGAYVYTYGDVDKRTRYWVPVDPKCVKYACSGDSMSTASITATAVVSLPEEYREYYAEGDSVPVLVIYEKVYGSSSSVM